MVFDPDHRLREHIKAGQEVFIIRFFGSDQWFGKVLEIIDDDEYNKEGIEVRLEDGFTGNIVRFHETWPTDDELKEMIQKHENEHVEFKSTYKIDFKNGSYNSKLPLNLVKEIVAFLNSDISVGYLCLGIDDQPTILGLDKDYNEIRPKIAKDKKIPEQKVTNSMLQDKLELEIRSQVTKYMYDKPEKLPLKFKFYDLDGKDICLIKTKNSYNIPYYVKPDSNLWNEEFRVRDGTSKKRLNLPKSVDYIKRRFE